jgi:hypothetical protein
MSSNWRRFLDLVAIVIIGWFVVWFVSQSRGQEADPFRVVAPPKDDLFGEVRVPKPNTTLLAAPNAAPRV